MYRGVQCLEVAMFDQTSYISFGVRDVHSEKSYHELRKVWFRVELYLQMAQIIPALFCRFNSQLLGKDVDFDLKRASKGGRK